MFIIVKNYIFIFILYKNLFYFSKQSEKLIQNNKHLYDDVYNYYLRNKNELYKKK